MRFNIRPSLAVPIALAVVIALPVVSATAQEKSARKPAKTDSKKNSGKSAHKKTASKESKKMPALTFKMNDIDGKEHDLRQYSGNVILMVNVASECGLTPHYAGIQEMYEKYKDRGFVVLGFPANNFGAQEPGSNEEIKAFCTKKFHVSFPIFAKVSVKGEDTCKLYKYLTDEDAGHEFGGEIRWNFEKIIIGRDGTIADRFHPKTAPDDKKLVAALEKQLAVEIPEDSALAKKKKKAEQR